MEAIKKYWWVIVIAILVGIAVWFLKPDKIITILPSQIPMHEFDSLVYVHKLDSVNLAIKEIKTKLTEKQKDYDKLLELQKKERENLRHLTATEIIKKFSEKVNTPVETVLSRDTQVIVPLNGIRNAVLLFTRTDQCEDREISLVDQNSRLGLLIISQDPLLKIKDTRLVALMKEFYSGEITINTLNNALEKEKKKNRTKNIILGIVSGAAAVAIGVIAIIK
jgi:hypothetical protein